MKISRKLRYQVNLTIRNSQSTRTFQISIWTIGLKQQMTPKLQQNTSGHQVVHKYLCKINTIKVLIVSFKHSQFLPSKVKCQSKLLRNWQHLMWVFATILDLGSHLLRESEYKRLKLMVLVLTVHQQVCTKARLLRRLWNFVQGMLKRNLVHQHFDTVRAIF